MVKQRKRPGTRAEQKYEKKLEFYSKVSTTVASLNAEKSISKKKNKRRSRQKKLKAYDLSTLSESLPDLEALSCRPPPNRWKIKCKTRQELVASEGKRLNKVLENPDIQSDFLGAVHRLLLRSQVLEEEKEKPKVKLNKNGSKKRKEKKAKAGAQSMDI